MVKEEKVTREEKKIEAINRMRELQMIPDAIKQFEKSEQIMFSQPPLGALFWVDNETELVKQIKEFETKYNALVYTVVRAYTEIGMMDSLLFVSDYREEWEYDNEGLPNGQVFSYTINYDAPEFSEFGSIGVEPIFGGLKRIW